MKRLRLVLGDQLNARHSWFTEQNDDTLYLIAELRQETDYVVHHIQKVVAFFMAMQNFATALQAAGHRVRHLTLDDTAHYGTLTELLDAQATDFGAELVEYQRPDEWRLMTQLRAYSPANGSAVQEIDTEHFLLPFEHIFNEFKPNKAHRMEVFYRRMRKRHGYLMINDQPEGGRWNFDSDNRKKFKAEDIAQIPKALTFTHPTGEIVDRLKQHNIKTLGRVGTHLIWPTTRKEALTLLNYFCEHCLPKFGQFQDAMTDNGDDAWSLYHSRLSFALNAKILSPFQVIGQAIQTYRESNSAIDLAQIEGFVRQILGWREFIRGIYWSNMPAYQALNSLNATRSLPGYFWNGHTQMKCMHQAIDQSLEYAYAHHIHRLMVTGNFALLAGIAPNQVDSWYLGIYIDAIEWVELPNTRGMSQFADGGLVASKPYAASGQYINRMSDYCKRCHYNVKHRHEEDACPFNSLYWDFMLRHRERLERNPRIGMIYSNWDNQTTEDKARIVARAEWCLNNLDML